MSQTLLDWVTAMDYWPNVLASAGIDEGLLDGKARPCPICKQGTDRFTFTNRDGLGTYVCRGCVGPQGKPGGTGFWLLTKSMGWSAQEGLAFIENFKNGRVPKTEVKVFVRTDSTSPALLEKARKKAEETLRKASPMQEGDRVSRYLKSRGLDVDFDALPQCLRLAPALPYFDVEKDENGDSVLDPKGKKKFVSLGEYPAQLAPVVNQDGSVIAVHRTYLSRIGDGKAEVPSVKKLSNELGPDQIAIPLYTIDEDTDILCVCEGIETAIAVHLMTGKPVWACYAAPLMPRMWIPSQIKQVWIFADNDAPDEKTGKSAGTEAAKKLHARLTKDGIACRKFLPSEVGEDWLDVYLKRKIRAN